MVGEWLAVARNRTGPVPWLGAARMRVKAGFDEAAHPRDETGKFAEGGGETGVDKHASESRANVGPVPRFKSKQEAQQWAKDELGVEADYSNCRRYQAQWMNEGLAMLKDRGIDLPPRVKFVSRKDMREHSMPQDVHGYYDYEQQTVCVNGYHNGWGIGYDDASCFQHMRNLSPGEFATSDQYGTISHEVGHYISHEAFRARGDTDIGWQGNQFVKPDKVLAKTVGEGLSRYATTNIEEAFAEGFSRTVSGGTVPSAVRPWFERLHYPVEEIAWSQ